MALVVLALACVPGELALAFGMRNGVSSAETRAAMVKLLAAFLFIWLTVAAAVWAMASR